MIPEIIKFKPFLSATDRPIKGNLCIFELYGNHIYSKDHYSFEEEDEETGDYTARQVDSLQIFLKTQINSLSFYWVYNQSAYFIEINGACWGFTERNGGIAIFNRSKEWLCR